TSISKPASSPPHFNKRTQFPLFALPPEIRNKIYAWTFVLSRNRDETYNIPDFIVHGDLPCEAHWNQPRGGIRWKNVARFELLLTCKQVFLEALPVISGEAFMEIKVYSDDRLSRRARKADAAYVALLRTAALCQDVRRVVLTVNQGDWDVDFREDEQLPRLAKVLAAYPKLKDVTLKVWPEALSLMDECWVPLHGFFGLCEKDLSLCIELMDYALHPHDVKEWAEEIEQRHKDTELLIENLIKRLVGKRGEVWVEWDIIPESM
ncbi:hypothetical protein LSUE1_G006236, partial [Lachnellula suecica]